MATKSRLEALRERKAKLEEELKAVEAREKAKDRKEDTRLKVLIGAGMLADAKIDDTTALYIKDVLQKSITSERDREFLRRKGWLEAEAPKKPEGETAGQ